MENPEKKMTHEDGLLVIQQMIADTKKSVCDNSFGFLLWGWLVIAGAISEFILIKFTDYKYHWLPWFITMFLGAAISMIYYRKEEKTVKVKTYVDEYIGYLWGGFCIGLLVTIFCSVSLHVNPGTFILIMTAIATFATGNAIKFNPLMWGGISFFAFAIVSALLEKSIYQLPVMAIAMVVGYLIPGYILKYRYKNEAA